MEEVKKNIDIYKDDIKVKANYTATLESWEVCKRGRERYYRTT